MCSLKARGFRTLSFSDVIDWVAGKKIFPMQSVVLTFDDGYASLYEKAFPLLEAMGFKATVFLTTGYCGKTNNWPTPISDIPLLPMLKWEQIKEMARSVFDIQAHTISHPILTNVPMEKLRAELTQSKAEIEGRLGKSAGFFAYPYGKFNDRVYEMVHRYFDAACSTRLNFADLHSDRYLLERIDMYYFSGMFSSQIFGSPFLKSYLFLRQLMRKFA